jgi:anaerobic selenocysteine-containing dehydrogenase
MDILYHPDRVLYPLLRQGARGEGKWRVISWDEAVGLIVERFDAIRREAGPEYISIAQGTGRPYMQFTGRLCYALGSPNFISPAHNCHVPRVICSKITLGWYPSPDVYGRGGAMPRCLMMLGCNIVEWGGAGHCTGQRAFAALKGAEKSIVIDPRSTASARRADLHLAVRPGTDCALLLAMIHTIIREKAYDADFVANYCAGFEELKEHVRPFTPQWAAAITRVPADKIEEAALSFARLQPAALIWENGIDLQVSSFQTARAALILTAICGTLDVPGGMVRWVPPQNIREKPTMLDAMNFLSQEQKKKVISNFPFCPGAHPPSFWQACVSGRPYRPQAMWLIGTNPILTHTRGDLVQKALRDHLDFVVVSDFFITPTAAVSDLVLPANHWLEQDDVMNFGGESWCVAPRKRIVHLGQTRDDREVMIEVARKLGLHEAFPWKDWPDFLNWMVEPTGLSFEEFKEKDIILGEMKHRKYETEGFPTPSGKVELVSSIMKRMGLPALPVYTEPPLSPVSKPDLKELYPFIFITGCKIMPFFHSEGRNVPSLRKLHPRPNVDMHPEAADRLGFAEGQRVKVSTPHGSQEFFLHRDDRMPIDTVHAEHAWWFAEQGGPDFGSFTSNVNLLFGHENFDPLNGAESLKSGLCQVEPL